MAATGFHILPAVGLRKHSLGGASRFPPRRSVAALPRQQSLWDYLEAARDFSGPEPNSPSRWFSPLESKARSEGAPLLLFLPGIDGNGLGLIRQHHQLGQGSVEGEEGNQDFHIPGVIPQWPGRYYFYFGKEIQTGEQELRDREKAKKVYAEVKKEVERCIEFVKQKREVDPYRPLLPRLHYHLQHGLLTQVPNFPF